MKYIIRIDNQEYEVEIKDLRARPIIAIVDGEEFQITPGYEQSAVPSASLSQVEPTAPRSPAVKPALPTPPSAVGSAGASVVRAPIPGVILEIKVKPGDSVTPGQDLFIIEAMKMKNTIRATRNGVISEILSSPGATVNHNAPILSYREE